MSSDQLPPDFAPYHLVRLDLPRVQGAGKFFDLGIAATSLDFMRRLLPECEWGILTDGGLLDDTKIRRKPLSDLSHELTTAAGPTFRVVRRAA